jgi:hypothetical protein
MRTLFKRFFPRTARVADVILAYRAVLGREPESHEAISQSSRLPIDVLYRELIASAEFERWRQGAGADDVTRAHRLLLEREPTAVECKQWLGAPIDLLYRQLLESEEHRARRSAAGPEDVIRAYRTLLGRTPGPEEPIVQWVGQPASLMYETIVKSAEYLHRQGRPALPRNTLRPSQLNPPVEISDKPVDPDKPVATSNGFIAFAAAYGESLSDLNQFGTRYSVELFDLLDRLIDHETRCVVEYGSGLSTLLIQELLLAKAGRRKDLVFLSIDHNQDWQRQVARALPPRAFTHLRTIDLIGECETTSDHGYNYATAPQLLQRDVDVAFVDGRTRAQSVLAVATCLKQGGTIILDDAERERYQFVDHYFQRAEAHGRFKILTGPVLAPRGNRRTDSSQKRALVRIVSGPQAEIEAAISKPSLENYASRCNAELVEVRLEEDDRRFSLAKLGLGSELAPYDRVLLLDCDLVIRPTTPDLFQLVPSSHIGAVREDRYVDRSSWLSLMSDLYGVPPFVRDGALYFNSGVLVLSREHYGLLKVPEGGTIFAHPLFEQTYLNARLRALGFPFYELPKEFNYIPQYDPKFALDWRFGSIIHLAGGQESAAEGWRRRCFWEEIPHADGVVIRRESKLLFRHIRVPHLRALAAAVEQGYDYKIITAADLEFRNAGRLTYLPRHGVLGADLSGAPEDVVVSTRISGLRAQRYRGELRLTRTGARCGPLRFELLSAAGICVAPTDVSASEDDQLISFQWRHAVDAEIEFRARGCEGCIFESLTLIPQREE